MNARVLTCTCNDTVELDPGGLKRALSAAGVKAECVVVPGANHFTIVDELARTGSAMVERVLHFARA